MKKCSKCKDIKHIDEFYNSKNGKFGKHHYCKICLSNNKKKNYDYDKAKRRLLKTKYNITCEQLNEIYIAQEKKCKICKKQFDILSKHHGLYIDHCHTTGKVRGLLCRNCNALLGNCKDDINILLSSISYLKKCDTFR